MTDRIDRLRQLHNGEIDGESLSPDAHRALQTEYETMYGPLDQAASAKLEGLREKWQERDKSQATAAARAKAKVKDALEDTGEEPEEEKEAL